MNNNTKQPKKEYIVLREKLNLEYGFNMGNSVMFMLACNVYKRETDGEREVMVSNLNAKPQEGKLEVLTVKGNSPLGLICLGAAVGDLLEIKIEGTDASAKAFYEDLKVGLNQEGYFQKEFASRNRALMGFNK